MVTTAQRAPNKSHKLISVRTVGRRKVVNRVSEILRLSQGKRVLHLGCADYPFTERQGEQLLHQRLDCVASDLWGLDASEEGLKLLRAMGFVNLISGDVEHLRPQTLPGAFDLIIAGEIIEHLACPGAFLTSVRSIMGPQTELILTTPNASGIKQFTYALFGKEKVHPDHNYFFSFYTLSQLLEKFGFVQKETYYYQEVRGQGVSLAIDRCLSMAAYTWPLVADGLFVRATRGELNAEGVVHEILTRREAGLGRAG